MADSSTSASLILDLIAGDCWARRQLPSGIKDAPVALELMRSLTLVGVVVIGAPAIPVLDGRFFFSYLADPGSDYGRLLGLTPARQWYKVRPCRIRAREIAVFWAGYIRYQAGDILLDGRYLHYQSTDCHSVCQRLLGLMRAC